MNNEEQFLSTLNASIKPIKPQFIGNLNGLLFAFSVLLLSFFFLLLVLLNSGLELIAKYNIQEKDINIFLMSSVACFVISILWFIYDYVKKPQPRWRIKNELICGLYNLGLIPYEPLLRRNVLFIYPIKINHKTKVAKVHFVLNSSKFNKDRIKSIIESSAFKYVQKIDIQPYLRKNKLQNGWLVYLFYDSLNNTMDRNANNIGGFNE